MYAHDKIATRRMTPTSASASVSHGHGAQILTHAEGTTDALLERLSHYAEPNIKIVRIEKTVEPLGATVKVCSLSDSQKNIFGIPVKKSRGGVSIFSTKLPIFLVSERRRRCHCR